MSNDLSNTTTSLGGDLLRGAKEIADYIGEPNPKKIYHYAAKHYLPIGRMGALLVASKKRLREHLDRLTADSPEEPQLPTHPRIIRRRPANMRRGRRRQATAEAAV